MQEALAVTTHADSRVHHLVVVRALAEPDQVLIDLQRHNQRDLDAAQCSRLQRLLKAIIGNQVRHGDADSAVRRVYQRYDEPLVVFARISRPAGQRLRRDVTDHLRIRDVTRVAEELAGLEIPVFGEYRLQLERDRSGETHVQLFVSEAWLERRIDEVLRTCVTDRAVDYRDLAVIAQVRGVPPGGRIRRASSLPPGFPPLRGPESDPRNW